MTLFFRIKESATALAVDRRFQIGLFLRLLLLLSVPVTFSDWFLPFYQNALSGNPLAPWCSHLAQGGDPVAFPYGLVTYLLFLPLTALGILISHVTGLEIISAVAFGLTIVVLDCIILGLVINLRPKYRPEAIILYWLSPIVLYVGYWHGQIDIVPLTLLLVALLAVSHERMTWSAVALALAVSCKFSFALAVPFFVVFLYRHPRRIERTLPFLSVFAATWLLVSAPILLSPAARGMVFGTSEAQKLFDFSINLTSGLSIYLIPAVYLVLLYGAWWVKRISAELLIAFQGAALFIIVTMTPASPGWYLWPIPFFALTFAGSRSRIIGLVHSYNCLVLLYLLPSSSGGTLPQGIENWGQWFGQLYQNHQQLFSMIFSLVFAIGVLLSVLLVREGILRNDQYRLSRNPVAIGIAGDSGSGKDTLSDAVIDLVGKKTAVSVSGDDYHIWDRNKPMWQVMTHLNPNANYLEQMRGHVLALLSGISIRKRHYDHSIGKMTKPEELLPHDVVIVSGLHALFDPALYSKFDLRIFLDMQDDLRRYLKIKRDVEQRGHTLEKCLEALERRQLEREKYILPQAENAQMILCMLPVHPRFLEQGVTANVLDHLKLQVIIEPGAPYKELVKMLIVLCGAHVDVDHNRGAERLTITLEGDFEAEDIALIAQRLYGDLCEILPPSPVWASGITGLMQLFVINQLSYELGKKIGNMMLSLPRK